MWVGGGVRGKAVGGVLSGRPHGPCVRAVPSHVERRDGGVRWLNVLAWVGVQDKWKTLVHTARIAPHQRRGEPVPQELLERVTRAHSFWTAHAAKQQADLDF